MNDFLYSPNEDPIGPGPSIDDDFDSSQDPPIKDVSGLFNERGFYKANGLSFNEEEIINDFSGNLIYNIPLYNYKLHGELPFDMKLVYNGSVSHSIKIGDPTSINTGLKNTYNMNMPEWLFSINGICVQAFNFISKYFSKPATNSSTLQDYYVNMQIPGYHYTNDLRVITTGKDTILLLMGDGSTLTIENELNDPEETHYIGNYKGKGKENYVKAKVDYIESQSAAPYPYYRRRKIILMRGDGLEYVFEEVKNQFTDFTANQSLRQKPMMPLLREIKDRFGFSIKLNYTGEYSSNYGRPFLNNISVVGLNSKQTLNFNIEYYNRTINIYHESDLNNDYYIKLEDEGTYYIADSSDNKNRIGRVKQITNSLNQTFDVEYKTNASDEYYSRKYTGVYNPFGPTLAVNFNKLKRIRRIKTFLDLRRSYNYKDELSMELNVASLYSEDPPHLLSSRFKGYGRDTFFSNMLSDRTEFYIEGGSTINKNKIIYSYSFNPIPSNRDLSRKPICKDDLVGTDKSVLSLDNSTINNSENGLISNLRYCIYPLYDPNNHFAYTPDVDASTKLIEDVSRNNSDGSIVNTKSFEYDSGTGDPLTGGYNGSFLMKKKIDSYNNISKIWEWEFIFKDNDPDKFIIESREKNPFQAKQLKKFKDYFITFDHKLFSNDYNFSSIPQDLFNFYVFNLIEEEYIELPSSPGVKNNRKKYFYIDSTNDSKGYIGQKIKEQIYENNSSNMIEINYLYCKNDRAGEGIFQASGSFPFKEGNIREIIKPNGQVTKYYYHPIEAGEVIIGGNVDEESDIPYLKYLVKYNNSTIVTECDKIWDHRFPIRTDNVKRIGSTDTVLLTTYKSYMPDGSPAKSIEQYKFLTEFKYQKIHRISKITFPGDFSTEPDGEEVIIIDNIYEVDTILKSNKWGKINTINEGYYADTFGNISVNCAGFYSVYRYDPANPGQNIKMNAFIGFGIDNLGIPISLEIATLRLFIRDFPQSLNGAPYLPKQALMKGITGFEEIHGGDCPGYGKRFFVNQNQLILTVIDTPSTYTENLLDIKNIITPGLKGFLMVPYFNLIENGYTFYGDISFLYTAPPDQNWYDNYAPSLILKGTFNNQIIIRKPLFKGGTLTYLYDDVNNKIDTYTIRNTIANDKSQTTYYIDHSGNIKRTDIFTGGTPQAPTYDSFYNKFNFINKTSQSIDGVGNITKFSYDGLQRLIRTDNQDGSFTKTSFSYLQSISDYYFGTILGNFIEKQIFTDENGNNFEKYYDALGNLRREVKFLSGEIPSEGDAPPPIKLITDYLYDSLNRLIKVKTPEGKIIEYQYDGYGRQNKRITVDSGVIKFQYDSNNNLITSQDVNQSAVASYIFTFRKYDALNRLTVLGENSLDRGDISQIDPDADIDYTIGDNPDPYFDYLIVNVYDDLSTASATIFSPPADYLPTSQNYNYFTKGRLVATAYRTRKTDLWNFKYYKYDERGRVGTIWHVMDGLETKKIEYNYNSQDQLINYTIVINPQESKRFRFDYDKPGRMKNLLLYTGAEELDNPLFYTNLAQYTYNSNSFISRLGLNDNKLKNDYTYNDRNWIQSCISQEGILAYNMFYYPNGNVQSLDYNGNYNNNFFPSNDLMFEFSYDKSNRLLSANCSNFSNKGFDLDNTYDKDGNILTLKRYRSDGFLADDFAYTYYAGTNKLKKVLNIYEDFIYDNNGNLISDDMNKNIEIKYDHRNLITLIKHLIYGIEGEFYTIAIYYYYDETGNRIRKVILQSYINKIEVADAPEELKNYPEYDEKTFEKEAKEYFDGDLDSPTMWFLVSNEYYLRGSDGKEIALFKGMNIDRFNIWGRDNEGYIDLQNHKYYYIKDHLGSVRVVVNEYNNIISAQDYDMWGSLMEGRSFDSGKSKYKFTGKERDKESNYDYFGARYYNPRIGRWGQVEPMIGKYPNFSPFIYSLNNSLIISDPNGKDPRRDQLGSLDDVVNLLQNNQGKSYDELKDVFGSNVGRYIYTEVGGFIDMQHFFAAAHEASIWGVEVALGLGEIKEIQQEIRGSSSAWNPEDLPSNKLGAIFGSEIAGNRHNLDIDSFIKYITSLKPVDPSDPKIAKDKVYIPEKESDPSLPKRKSYNPYHGERFD